jgi:hypothetical protein
MYYARRAWARIYSPGPILGVYDVDELTGRAHQEAHKVRDEGSITGLHERLAAAKQAAGADQREGFQDGASQDLPAAASEKPKEAKKAPRGRAVAPAPKKRASEQPKGKARPVIAPTKAVKIAKPGENVFVGKGTPPREAKADLPRLPTNAREYAQHVQRWLLELDTEEGIASRWRREMSLRNLCGVIEEERKTIRAVVDQRIAELVKD